MIPFWLAAVALLASCILTALVIRYFYHANPVGYVGWYSWSEEERPTGRQIILCWKHNGETRFTCKDADSVRVTDSIQPIAWVPCLREEHIQEIIKNEFTEE